MYGFYLVNLVVSGDDCSSSIQFEKGLNIIYGGSDIGKTFIFQCIEYMLGSDNKPKEIKESYSYLKCELTIRTYTGKEYLLSRDLSGKRYELRGDNIHKKSIDSISNFLLSLTNMENKNIKIDNYERVSLMSFKQLKRYFLVDEDAILIKKSYITGQTLYERNILKFLITGKEATPREATLSQSEIDKHKGELKEIDNKIFKIKEEIQSLELNNLFKNELDEKKKAIELKKASIKLELESITTKILEQNIKVEIYQNKIFCPICKTKLSCPHCGNKNTIKYNEIKFFNQEDNLVLKKELEKKLLKEEKNYQEIILQLFQLDKLTKDKNYYEERQKKLNKTIRDAEEKLKKMIKIKSLDFDLTPITKIMLTILKEIKFENIESVEFSKKDSDFIINNQHRELYGQGYRAIIYSTFILAILKYLKNKDYQIGFMMIDSPLNPYKPKENNLSLNLADNYYEYLATNHDVEDRQVIIFENTKVPINFKSKIRPLGKNGFLQTTLF